MKENSDNFFRQLFELIAVFVVATCISYPFRNNVFHFQTAGINVFGVPVFRVLLEASGPLIATLIFTRGFKRYWNPVTFFGSSPIHATIVIFCPALAFFIAGIPNAVGISSHVYGFVVGLTVTIYCVMEESLWRGFLQNRLSAMQWGLRYLLVGAGWYFWHTSYLADRISLVNEAIFFILLVAGSFGLGRLAEKTNSVFVTATFHLLINILSLNQLTKNQSTVQKTILACLCLAMLIPVLMHWSRRDAQEKSRQLVNQGATP